LTGILRNVVELVPPLASQVNAEVPEPLARFVARLFEKKPEDRIDSAATALAELQKLKAQIAPVKLEVIEELSPDMAIASPKADRSMHSSTDRNFDDVTPPVTSVHGTGAIPPTLFWAVVSPLAAILIIAGTVIRLNTDPRPSVTIPATKQAEFVAKRHALDEARQLFAAAQYEQSVNAYDDYLRRYPNSITAQNGRNEAAKALDAAKSKTSVTARASAPKKTPEKEQPQPSRFKRFMNKITGKKK
ncbi:MAG: hypothetical protein ACXVJT_16060, partial [Thermoanaerobaculia bacterium]